MFRLAPYLVFVTPIFVTTLIPALTDYPLAFAFMVGRPWRGIHNVLSRHGPKHLPGRMMMPTSIPDALNMLSAGLILIAAFGMVATRQVQGIVRFFLIQSLLLSASSFLLGYGYHSVHLWALGAITVVAKVIAVPWFCGGCFPVIITTPRDFPSSEYLFVARNQ